MVGKIVGRDGRNISKLRRDTGAYIRIPKVSAEELTGFVGWSFKFLVNLCNVNDCRCCKIALVFLNCRHCLNKCFINKYILD